MSLNLLCWGISKIFVLHSASFVFFHLLLLKSFTFYDNDSLLFHISTQFLLNSYNQIHFFMPIWYNDIWPIENIPLFLTAIFVTDYQTLFLVFMCYSNIYLVYTYFWFNIHTIFLDCFANSNFVFFTNSRNLSMYSVFKTSFICINILFLEF